MAAAAAAAVVVSQTLPFNPSTLDLQNPTRWTTLLPLLRATIKPIPTSKGLSILADTAKAKGKKYIHIIAAGAVGNFSSKLLDDRHVTAIITESTGGAGILTAADLPHALEAAVFELGPGGGIGARGERTSERGEIGCAQAGRDRGDNDGGVGAGSFVAFAGHGDGRHARIRITWWR